MYPILTYTNTPGTYSFGGPGTPFGTVAAQGITWDPALLGLSFHRKQQHWIQLRQLPYG